MCPMARLSANDEESVMSDVPKAKVPSGPVRQHYTLATTGKCKGGKPKAAPMKGAGKGK